ncbi:MAG: anhydro-N-acetylmuramic acid kinase [Bacteroidetes bacterium]|nr:anhydro-N-acetylmuramic acid kinase [Bacteroidota bacterium]
METYRVIGIMSGTSLDGIDIALCDFVKNDSTTWNFDIIKTKTIPYTSVLKEKLSDALNFSGIDLMLLNNELGSLIGQSINNFIDEFNLDKKTIDFISSHGHTVFHQPNKNLTTQIGNGANISSITKIPVVCDFRSVDVSLNGNGAPLVPIGDKMLFPQYDYCVNLGGIANISYQEHNQTLAFDICPVNIVLNKLVGEFDLNFDNGGQLAKKGKINALLLNELNELAYYKLAPPKSLGIEWINQELFPIINKYNIEVLDKLRTFVEHIAAQLSKVIKKNKNKVLFTGGGVYNKFLMDRISNLSTAEIIIPSKEIIEFKEALIFAFLGVLRYRNETNCLSSVTGAELDSIGGCIYSAS